MMQQHFVAFIDILGFSMMVEADCASPTRSFDNLVHLKETLESVIPSNSDSIFITQFSDSIVLAKPYDPQAFSAFAGMCGELQLKLLLSKVLVRGGIASGFHYADSRLVFSQGLIEAYRMESQKANNPRILVSPDLIALLQYVRKSPIDTALVKESDGETFVNFLASATPDQVEG